MKGASKGSCVVHLLQTNHKNKKPQPHNFPLQQVKQVKQVRRKLHQVRNSWSSTAAKQQTFEAVEPLFLVTTILTDKLARFIKTEQELWIEFGSASGTLEYLWCACTRTVPEMLSKPVHGQDAVGLYETFTSGDDSAVQAPTGHL